ncbi:MAG: hypothetical protein ABFD92_20650 [Planctomycetaceae bacterium]|nr:hypothetical protein [Planctomycetaceae bacterium]
MAHVSILMAVVGAMVCWKSAASASGPDHPPAAGPPASTDYRALLLGEVARLRQLKQPEFIYSDEHLDRGVARKFRQAHLRARLVLARLGDHNAVDDLITEFGLQKADEGKWVLQHQSKDYAVFPTWPEEIHQVLWAIHPTYPELEAAVRERMMRLWGQPSSIGVRSQTVDQMSLEQLKEAAAGEGYPQRRDAMARWAHLQPEPAAIWLASQLTHKDADRGVDAARALAMIGRADGLAWLEKACLDRNLGLGGTPGAALLESGEKGAKRFFQLIEHYQKEHPGKVLPGNISTFAGHCNPEVVARLLPQLLAVNDSFFSQQVGQFIRNRRLTVDELALLIGHFKSGGSQARSRGQDVVWSLAWKGEADKYVRELAGLWADELHQSPWLEEWQLGARLFVHSRLGTPGLAAAGGRRHLQADPVLACQVLGEAGDTEDIRRIWDMAHAKGQSAVKPPYDSYYWLPMVSLIERSSPSGENAREDGKKPLERLSPKLHVRYAQGRLNVNLAGPSEGVTVVWFLPKQIREPLRESLDPTRRFPEVLLYRGKDMDEYLAPSGSPKRPRPHEKATAGILECEPLAKEKTVRITLRNLEFQTVTIPQIGPLEVLLDGVAAP